MPSWLKRKAISTTCGEIGAMKKNIRRPLRNEFKKNTEPQRVPGAEEMEREFSDLTLPDTVRPLGESRLTAPRNQGVPIGTCRAEYTCAIVPFPLSLTFPSHLATAVSSFPLFHLFLAHHLSVASLSNPLEPPLSP